MQPTLIRGHFQVWFGIGLYGSELVSISPARTMRSLRTARLSECNGENFLTQACDAIACGLCTQGPRYRRLS